MCFVSVVFLMSRMSPVLVRRLFNFVAVFDYGPLLLFVRSFSEIRFFMQRRRKKLCLILIKQLFVLE